ncbi:MAG: haloacid dehalogenase type II [Burkholderiales bacterium]
MSLQCLVFDAYGTLFDVHSVGRLAEEIFPGHGARLSQLWRQKQLEYTWQRSLMGRYEDFSVITRDSLEYACRALEFEYDATDVRRLLDAYRRLDAYPETRAALEMLLPRRLAILSNGSPSMLDPLVKNAGLKNFFDHVISVHELKIYKPHPRVYQMACDKLGLEPAAIGFVSSNFWDVSGAGHFGMRAFWISRSGAVPDPLGYTPTAVLSKLTDLKSHV